MFAAGMIRFLRILATALTGLLIAAGAASAHPHVWVTMKSAVVYGPDGAITGVRHSWTFDDMYSAFATQGLEQKKKGEFTPRGVAAARQGQRRVAEGVRLLHLRQGERQGRHLRRSGRLHLEFDPKETVLTLHFVLPLKTPVKAKALNLEVFDPTYFVDFALAEKDPVSLEKAPAGCQFERRQAAGNDQGDGAEAGGNSAGRQNSGQQLRGGVLQQDIGEMSLTKVAGERTAIALMLFAAAASLLLAAGALDVAFAQGAPFGAPRGAPPPPSDGIIGWMFAKQAEFYRDMSRIIRAAKTDGSAVWTLLGVSFVYGIFHAAGPGHGKAVISSYLVANEETWRRGIVLSFASALLQAFVAVAIVGIAAVLLNATAGQMCSAERVIELASYALIALVGARLIWVKGKGFLREARSLSRPLHAVGAAVTPQHDHKHDHDHHDHGHDHDHDHAHHDHAPSRSWPRSRPSSITTTITITARPGAMPTGRSRRNWPGRAAGSAASRRSSRSACGPARAPSSCWCSRWRRACSGPASPRPS